MSIETVFYTQLGSIIAFIVALFVLYRVLVKSKDATIETLKTQISFLETKVKDLAETSPDILLHRYEKRSTLLADELEKAEKEKEPLLSKIDELQNALVEAGTKSETEKRSLITELVAVTQRAATLEEKHSQLSAKIREIEDPYMAFLHYANAEVSPGRKEIVGEISQYMGIDFVIGSSPDNLIKTFDKIYKDTEKSGMHPEISINMGAMTGLRSVGIINDKGELTLLGVSVFKTIARELRSNKGVN